MSFFKGPINGMLEKILKSMLDSLYTIIQFNNLSKLTLCS